MSMFLLLSCTIKKQSKVDILHSDQYGLTWREVCTHCCLTLKQWRSFFPYIRVYIFFTEVQLIYSIVNLYCGGGLVAKSCQTFSTLWTVACQAPLFMGFSVQEYWSGLLFPPPGDLPDQVTKPKSLASPALAGGFFTTSATWEAPIYI